MEESKRQFVNESEITLGAVVLDEANNKFRARAVAPGGSVWLSEREQRATANAPASDVDNPFNKGLNPRDEERYVPSRVIPGPKPVVPEERGGQQQTAAGVETTATAPQEAPTEGSRSDEELVGTPQAQKTAPEGQNGAQEAQEAPPAPKQQPQAPPKQQQTRQQRPQGAQAIKTPPPQKA